MGRPGPKPRHKVIVKWSPDFAYAIGLLATDGNLSPDGRHLNLTSKDLEQVQNFQKALSIAYNIGRKGNGMNKEKKYYVVQFGDVFFYAFLEKIGLHKRKSKTLGPLSIPDKYFFSFLRGVFDGDGSTYSYWDKRWKSSFMFYLGFASASRAFIDWLQIKIKEAVGSVGHVTKDRRGSTLQLKYAKAESFKVLKRMYSKPNVMCLSRKRLKIEKMLAIVGKSL
ncbi:MAG: hypothetical protein Q8R17_00415 [bacterium]|nr:hypothetical protein [bacterium]